MYSFPCVTDRIALGYRTAVAVVWCAPEVARPVTFERLHMLDSSAPSALVCLVSTEVVPVRSATCPGGTVEWLYHTCLSNHITMTYRPLGSPWTSENASGAPPALFPILTPL